MNSKDCVQYIANWVRDNPGELLLDNYSVKLKANGHYWITDGTDPKTWKRLTKKKFDNIEYRLFQCSCCIFNSSTAILLEEQNGAIRLTHGLVQTFSNHPAVGRWVREYCGIEGEGV